MEAKRLSVESRCHQSENHRVWTSERHHLNACLMCKFHNQGARIGDARSARFRHQSDVLSVQGFAKICQQIRVFRVVFVELYKLEFVDWARHVHLAEHSACSPHIFDHEESQSTNYFECTFRNDLFRRGRPKQRRKKI